MYMYHGLSGVVSCSNSLVCWFCILQISIVPLKIRVHFTEEKRVVVVVVLSGEEESCGCRGEAL